MPTPACARAEVPSVLSAFRLVITSLWLVKIAFPVRQLIAERERGEALMRLKENEQRLRALVAASSDMIYAMSPDWVEMRQLDGRGFLANTDAPSVQWLDEYLLPEDYATVRAAVDEAIAAGKAAPRWHCRCSCTSLPPMPPSMAH
ncbi:hypothetical protein [Qipengyuania spongiae]|uniref:PAS domain-containing protein n=1 Tax=Qipengyuania spongiae TaxID=2909673 RepID=A0ABY5T225_9SPHN|nr:hypothetical protein [Qipengyuania spongiae]UVI39564.1 hypothetical protein L1F33_00945 [Qipengyuania spongiae]